MKVDIISGFLGAGKTTLIKKLLDTLVKDEKVAIVENEYGEVGIDGDLLKDRRIEVKEINSGCICCTIKGDFKQNILDIISNYRPDRIIIEPSGVANFSQVLESIKELEKIKPGSPVYNEAVRLRSFLNFFKEIEFSDVPENSILREFIGGSCFYKY
mgnify:CR=1 FL=1